MDKQHFISLVFARLPALVDEQDRGVVTAGIAQQHAAGWSVDDSVSFHSVMQEFNPNYPEDQALRIMHAISGRYERGRKLGCGCCVGPVGDRCCCDFHCDIPRGELPCSCSLHQPPGVVR